MWDNWRILPQMNHAEQQKVIEVCVDQVNGRIPVIAGTGDTSTKLVIEATKHALDVGSDAAIIVNPYYMKPKGGKGDLRSLPRSRGKCRHPNSHIQYTAGDQPVYTMAGD